MSANASTALARAQVLRPAREQRLAGHEHAREAQHGRVGIDRAQERLGVAPSSGRRRSRRRAARPRRRNGFSPSKTRVGREEDEPCAARAQRARDRRGRVDVHGARGGLVAAARGIARDRRRTGTPRRSRAGAADPLRATSARSSARRSVAPLRAARGRDHLVSLAREREDQRARDPAVAAHDQGSAVCIARMGSELRGAAIVRQSGARRNHVAKLGFIGTGTMGNPIAVRLLDAGHELVVFGRVARGHGEPRASAARGASVAARGGAGVRGGVQLAAGSRRRCARSSEGADGLLAAQRAGLVHVDLSTSSLRGGAVAVRGRGARGCDADRRAGLGRRARRRAGHARGDGERRPRRLRRGAPALRRVRVERLLPGRVRARHDREARQQPDLPRRARSSCRRASCSRRRPASARASCSRS